MKIFYNTNITLKDTFVAVGSFNGLHRGHQSLLHTLLQQAKAGHKTLLVVAGVAAAPGGTQLTTQEELAHLLQGSGIDALVFCAQSKKDIYTEAFFEKVVVGRLGGGGLAAGANCGQKKLLLQCAHKHGLQFAQCKTVFAPNGSPLSSSFIKKLVLRGDISAANAALGQPYIIAGRVLHGQALGRTIGLPTANIGFAASKCLPKSGVYCSVASIGAKQYIGLASIGRRPSVDTRQEITVENHILNFCGNLYGKTIVLQLHSRIRDIVNLGSLQGLQKQIEKDIVFTKAYFASRAFLP